MGFFKMFRTPKTTIELKIPRNSFYLGSKIDGTISVSSNEEFDATEVRAELRCIEKRRRERWVYNERLRRNMRHEYWDTATHLSDDVKVSGPIHFVPGFKKAFPVKINLPSSGLETLDSIDANVTWLLKGVVAVDDRPDATSDTFELQVIRNTSSSTKNEVEMVPCEYCKSLMPSSSSCCPICGAPRKS
ncbi:MAG: hypothetical protein P8Y18_07640 [Candidatus Bathyarchaeota archaeon]